MGCCGWGCSRRVVAWWVVGGHCSSEGIWRQVTCLFSRYEQSFLHYNYLHFIFICMVNFSCFWPLSSGEKNELIFCRGDLRLSQEWLGSGWTSLKERPDLVNSISLSNLDRKPVAEKSSEGKSVPATVCDSSQHITISPFWTDHDFTQFQISHSTTPSFTVSQQNSHLNNPILIFFIFIFYRGVKYRRNYSDQIDLASSSPSQ